MKRKKKASKKKKSLKKHSALLRNHLAVSRAVLEGEKRVSYLQFLKEYEGKGLYALYMDESLWYVGKASTLKTRIDNHLSDKHADKWNRFAMYIFADSTTADQIHHLESMLIDIADPPGNERKGKIPGSLQKKLEKFLVKDAKAEIKEMIHGVKAVKESEPDERGVTTRLTPKKIKKYFESSSGTQSKIAEALNVTQSYVAQLIKKDPAEYAVLRQFILDRGVKNKVLEIIDPD